jgi:hypothetical protein
MPSAEAQCREIKSDPQRLQQLMETEPEVGRMVIENNIKGLAQYLCTK